MAGLGLQFGPSDYYERTLEAGISVGYPVTPSSAAVRLLVTGGVLGAFLIRAGVSLGTSKQVGAR